jgi:membrane protease YdiL (CAAX protease family)
VLFPYLVGSNPAAYYGPLLPLDRAHYFLYGELVALALLGVIFLIEMSAGWIYWKPRFTAREAFGKSARSALSSLTVVAIEEPFFRAIILQQLLFAAAPGFSRTPVIDPWAAVALSAVLFSAAHFLRKVKTYWPFVGLAVLGVWLGVAYVETGNLWLPMGLHSGGILAIGLHRCFLNYKGPEWLVGTQTYPIAGALAMAVMLVGTAVTWWMF